MKYIKTYERRAKYPYSLDTGKGVDFEGLTKLERDYEIKKFKIVQEYFNVNAVSGSISKTPINRLVYDLDFGQNESGGMSVLFNISGDVLNGKCYGRIVIGYDRENNQFVGDGEGEELEFPFDYIDIENLRTNIERVIEWCKDPESYEMFKTAGKYNL
jgi:hypothetical protein